MPQIRFWASYSQKFFPDIKIIGFFLKLTRFFFFLDIRITRNNNTFMTSLYHKPSFSGVITNFGSFILKLYKYNLLFTLLHRAFKLCSNFECFHQEIDKLKTILKITVTPKVFFFIFVSKST